MSLGHFSYLLSGDQSRLSKVSSDRLEVLANVAARRYLGDGTMMNDSIAKMASENDLNANQIARVCEMANLATHRSLWSKTAAKESIAFDLADAKTVLRVVKKEPLDSCDPQSPPVSPTESDACAEPAPPSALLPPTSDYAGPPTGLTVRGPPIASMFSANPAMVHNGLHGDGPKKTLIIRIEKKASERASAASKLLYAGMQLESLEKRACNSMKQALLSGDTFFSLWEQAHAAGLSKAASKYFPEWQRQIIDGACGAERTRLEKLAIHKAPDDLISDDLGGVVVINGAHPVLVSLDTVTKKTGEIKNMINNLLRIDDEVKVYRQQLRELS